LSDLGADELRRPSYQILEASSTIAFETIVKSKLLSLISAAAVDALDEMFGALAAVEPVWALTRE